jgi:O-antigen/teichoic acid export membrane protein
MSESLTKRTLTGAAWIGGASVVRIGLRIISVAILARLLTPQEYGIVAGALVAVELAAMIYSLGLAPTLIQRKEVRPDHVATAFSSSLFMALLAGGGMWCAAPLIAEAMRISELAQILRVLAFLAPFGAFNALCEALLARNAQAKSIALRPLFSFTTAAFVVGIPLAYAGFGYWSLVAMQAAETIFGAAAFAFAAHKLLVRPGFSVEAFKELWPVSLGFSLNQPFVYLSSNADKFLIGRLIGTDALGLYTRASFITAAASNMFGNIARLSVFPAMALVQDDKERLRNALLKSLSVVAFLTLPASAFCIIFANEIIDILLGSQWNAAAVPLAILSGLLYLQLARRCCAVLFEALGRPNWITAVHILQAAALIVGIWWVESYGLAAICAVVVSVMGLVLALMFAVVRRAIGISYQRLVAVHVKPLAISAAISGVGITLKLVAADSYVPVLLVMTLLMVVTSLFLVARFKPEWLSAAPGATQLHTHLTRNSGSLS